MAQKAASGGAGEAVRINDRRDALWWQHGFGTQVVEFRAIHFRCTVPQPKGESDDCEGAVSLQNNVKNPAVARGRRPFS